MPSGCIPWTTPTRPPLRRSVCCLAGCPPAGQCRCSSSTPATTPPSSPSTWPSSGWRCWCGCDLTAAATPTRHRRPPGKVGRPRRHGAKFNCANPASWPAPTATLVCQDDQYGTVTVQAWAGLHPKQRHPGHGTRGPRPIVRGTILRVQVERVPARTRPPKVLWLWWAGPEGLRLDLHLAWRAYVRRFGLEHTVRFAKQALGWTIPRPRTPEQADRWTWLILAGYTQLRLARQAATDTRLPWERPRPQPRLSPYRVRRGFPRLLCAVGSPASAPKPSGCSPGRPKGRPSGPATRYRRSKSPSRSPGRSRPRPRRPPDSPAHPPRPLTSVDGQPGTPRVK
jgi:hypothetical protein